MLCKNCGSQELLKFDELNYQCQRCFSKQPIMEEKEIVDDELPIEEEVNNREAHRDHFFDTIEQSIVKLKSSGGFGSGFFIDDEGHVITNSHVVGNEMVIQGYLGASPIVYEFEVIANGESLGLDLAIIKLLDDTDFIALKLAMDEPKMASEVFVVGNPGNLGLSISRGTLSRIAEKEYQIDATVNPGNSGGPVLNEKGEVIGVISYLMKEVQGLGFAVSIEMLKKFIDASIKTKEEE